MAGHVVDEAGGALRRAERLERLALPAIAGLAAANLLIGLGSSSLYVDEVLSLGVSGQPLHGLLGALAREEITPPGWFVLLHEWGGRLGGLHREWVMRLPSALCVIALVGVVYWLVRLLDGARGLALAAAAMCALSPFELEYGQRAQGYAAAGLLVALALGAALASERGAVHRTRWLAASVVAAVAAILDNYTSVLVIAPLAVWILLRPGISRAWRWGYPAVCAATGLALVPLLVHQHAAFPDRPGVRTSAAFSGSSLLNMLELPFGSRVTVLRPLGVAATLVGLGVAVWALARRPGGFTARRLVLVAAIGEPLLLILLTAAGGRFWGHLMLNRYGSVAVPFIVVSLAIALGAAPRVLAAALGAALAVLLLAGTIANHRTASFYADARGAASFVRAHARPGDAVLEPPYPWYQVPLDYYGLAALDPVKNTPEDVLALVRRHAPRIWLVMALPGSGDPPAAPVLAQARAALRPYGYAPLAARVFPSSAPLVSLLAAPSR